MEYNSRLSRMKKRAEHMATKMGVESGFRSGLEVKAAAMFKRLGIGYDYEIDPIPYVSLPVPHKYHPDFRVRTKRGREIVIETKGRFMPDDMLKHQAIRLQHPEIDIRFVFSDSHKWHRAAKTKSYAKWCEQNGFLYCDFRNLEATLREWLK